MAFRIRMRRAAVLVSTFALGCFGAVFATSIILVAQAPDALFATWKLNLAKSTFDKPPATATYAPTITYERYGDDVKITIEAFDARNPDSSVTIAKFDGNDYPVLHGETVAGTRAFRRIDDRSYELTNKVDGKVTGTSISVVSADGKTLTITTTTPGNKTVRVYDKQ